MKTLKKIISMAIAVILSCTALVSCSGGSDNAKLERNIKVYALKGPTGMGISSCQTATPEQRPTSMISQ